MTNAERIEALYGILETFEPLVTSDDPRNVKVHAVNVKNELFDLIYVIRRQDRIGASPKPESE